MFETAFFYTNRTRMYERIHWFSFDERPPKNIRFHKDPNSSRQGLASVKFTCVIS